MSVWVSLLLAGSAFGSSATFANGCASPKTAADCDQCVDDVTTEACQEKVSAANSASAKATGQNQGGEPCQVVTGANVKPGGASIGVSSDTPAAGGGNSSGSAIVPAKK